MLFVKLWVVVLLLTAVSWVVLKLIRKPLNIGWIFLFWVVTLFGLAALLYGGSVWLAGA